MPFVCTVSKRGQVYGEARLAACQGSENPQKGLFCLCDNVLCSYCGLIGGRGDILESAKGFLA